MAISPARAAAFTILSRIESTDAFASELLHSARFAKLSSSDHGLLTELVMGVLRWRSLLDQQIATHLTQRLAKLDLEVLAALRLGSYQLLFLDRIPKHAAVHESVELVKQAHKRSAAGMVNAVLRKIAQTPDRPPNAANAHPHWLIERWERNYGVEAARKICEYNQTTPETTVRVQDPQLSKGVNGSARSQPFSSAKENEAGFQFAPGRLLSRAAVIKAATNSQADISQSQGYRERSLIIQDEGSQLVALLAGSGSAILDCCAAPGGKARILAEENPNSMVVALELHPHRAKLLRKLVQSANVRVIAADARHVPLAMEFDRVLVDAPCSGTGTLARNPEIKWRLQPEDLRRLQDYQLQILSAAMGQVCAGGRLIYSTCSLEPEENSQVIEKALAQHSSYSVIDCRNELQRLKENGELIINDLESLLDGRYLRTIPGVHHCDGFFAAILERG
jgi:16S rRNA (cytosine967-C5)-methyltransferase